MKLNFFTFKIKRDFYIEVLSLTHLGINVSKYKLLYFEVTLI